MRLSSGELNDVMFTHVITLNSFIADITIKTKKKNQIAKSAE